MGRPDIVVYGDTVENYEFLTVNGAWDLVATSNTLDQPFIFTLAPGDPNRPKTWLHWSTGRELMVPSQPFDTGQGISSVNFEHANSAFLCVGPQGENYLTYAGSEELTAYGGWGHARIGIARSSDLINWQVSARMTEEQSSSLREFESEASPVRCGSTSSIAFTSRFRHAIATARRSARLGKLTPF